MPGKVSAAISLGKSVPAPGSKAPPSAFRKSAAGDLEGYADGVARLEVANSVAHCHHLSHALVPEGEGSYDRRRTVDDRPINIACRDRERSDQGLTITCEPRCADILPFQLPHSHQIYL